MSLHNYNIGDTVYYLDHKYYVTAVGSIIIEIVNENAPEITLPVFFWSVEGKP